MSPQHALSILAAHFPDRYVAISANIGSMPNGDGTRREANRSVSVYVEGIHPFHFYSSTLEDAVNLCLLSSPKAEPNNEAEAIIATIEQPEATYPEMEIKEA